MPGWPPLAGVEPSLNTAESKSCDTQLANCVWFGSAMVYIHFIVLHKIYPRIQSINDIIV